MISERARVISERARVISERPCADGPDVVTVRRALAAPPEVVFRFWTEAEHYGRWMGRTARLDPRPGGEYFVEMGDGFAAAGCFLEVDAPWQLAFSWGWARGAGRAVRSGVQDDARLPPGASRAVVHLSDTEGGTGLRLEHHALSDRRLRDDHLLAWRTYLDRPADPGCSPVVASTRRLAVLRDNGSNA